MTVGTAVSRVIEDDMLPNSVRTGVLKAIMGTDPQADIPAYIMEEVVGSVGIRAERMYEWARTNYVHGLPSGAIYAAKEVEPAVKAELEATHASEVGLVYAKLGPPNKYHLGWIKLVQDYGYDPNTNQINTFTALEGAPCYLQDMVLVVPTSELAFMEEGVMDQWGPMGNNGPIPSQPQGRQFLKPSPPKVDADATEEYLLVTYQYFMGMTVGDQPGGYITKTQIVPLPTGYNDAGEYFQARYTVAGETRFWIYEKGSGLRLGLDQLFTVATANAEFFPFGYFRYDKVSEIADKGTESYRDGKKLHRYLGMDYDDLAEAMEENPDIADVEQAMTMFAVPASTQDELERRYLFSFFTKWWEALGQGYSDPSQGSIDGQIQKDADLTKYAIVIQDARFALNLTNGGIFKRRKVGQIAAIGGHASSITTQDYTFTFIDHFSGIQYQKVIPVKTHVYQKQVSGQMYDEILVVNLKMVYFIEGEHKVTADEEDDILLVPIDRSLTEPYTIQEKEHLYSRAMHYVWNSLVVTKVKWYQTGIFQALMIVVAIVVTFYSMGADGGALLAALGSGSAAAVGAAAVVLLEKLFFAFLISYALRLFVKVVGIEVALVLAIVAAVSGSVMALQAGGLAGAPFASQLLSLSNGLAKGVGHQVKVETGELIAEASEFEKQMEEQTKLLESAQELLENNSLLSPFVIFGESPDRFFDRTVHSGNIGMVSISVISNYVDGALKLPTLDETLYGTE